MPVIEFLSSSTVSLVSKFLLDQIVKYKKNKGTNLELEVLKTKFESYKEKTELVENELEYFKKIAGKLQTRLGNEYISENAYVNWNFNIIKPKISAFNIDVWTEKGDFQSAHDIVVIPKIKTCKIGNKINIYFRSEKDCYLTLINYGTSGKLTVLLPNALFPDNFIKGDRIYAIPGQDYLFEYILSGPPGIERIKSIATTRKINLMDMTYNKGEVFSTSRAAARDISVVAKNIETAIPEEWAEAVCEVKVE